MSGFLAKQASIIITQKILCRGRQHWSSPSGVTTSPYLLCHQYCEEVSTKGMEVDGVREDKRLEERQTVMQSVTRDGYWFSRLQRKINIL